MAATKDAVLNRAVDLAREVAVELAGNPADVGEHLGVTSEADRLVAHRFACLARGYVGWQWTVTLARVPRGRVATVCEAVLLPGPESVLAKPWLPWSQRLRPGDIGPGDVLPFAADDPRLEPGWTPSGDDDLDRVAIDELALARVRVLSPAGRDEAAMRWYRGTQGPTSPGAVASAAACQGCGFVVPLAGALGQLFGVCANEWSPDDGRVVSLDHGCGAHSQTDVDPEPTLWPEPAPQVDDLRLDPLDLRLDPIGTPDEVAAAGEAAPADEVAVGAVQPAMVAEPADAAAELLLAAEPESEAGAELPLTAEPEPVAEPESLAGPEPGAEQASESALESPQG